jgi:hypothetical protein
MSEVKFNKNGYEIRNDVLAMAKDAVFREYDSTFRAWEISSASGKDQTSMPQFPGLEKILETAEKMYTFVNAK